LLREFRMPHVYPEARKLEKHDKIGDKECVTLIKHYTNAGPARFWREGEKVLGARNLAQGTAMATFVDGRWPQLNRGNHSGFYLGQVSNGIYIMDQWPDDGKKPKISMRFLYRLGKDKSGKYIDPPQNADAFSVIE
jgi:hypothetical protein